MTEVFGGRRSEDVKVARAEDDGVEHLGEEGDAWSACQSGEEGGKEGWSWVAPTFGAAVAVDGPYQDELGDGVRNVAEDVEDVEAHWGRRQRVSPSYAVQHAADAARSRCVSRRGGQHASTGAGAVGTPGESEEGVGRGYQTNAKWGLLRGAACRLPGCSLELAVGSRCGVNVR